MPRMPYLAGLSIFSSTLILTTLALSRYFSATASTVGASIRQGPHQAAQKSTSTGLSDFRTSFSQFISVTSATNSLIALSFRFDSPYDPPCGQVRSLNMVRFATQVLAL